MINTINLSNKPLQDLLRDKVWLIDYMKQLAKHFNISIDGKWLNKFAAYKLDHPVIPSNYPSMLTHLLDILDIYIECKKYWAAVNMSTEETMFLWQIRAIEKSYLSYKKNKWTWKS